MATTHANSNLNFNNYADRVQLQQQWLYAERVADGSEGLGLGGRIDYLYGTDAPDTQAFGIANRHWDNSWDNGGAYGHAIPSVVRRSRYRKPVDQKLVTSSPSLVTKRVQATGNFFYSRQFTSTTLSRSPTPVFCRPTRLTKIPRLERLRHGRDSGLKTTAIRISAVSRRKLTDSTSLIYTNALGRFNDDRGSATFGETRSNSQRYSDHHADRQADSHYQIDYLETHNANQDVVRNTFV